METLTAFLVLLSGLLVRLALPIAVTLLAVYILRRLDAYWQAQAEAELEARTAVIEKPQCWKGKHCPPAQRKACPGFNSSKPCWQVFRLPNGYLHEECLACQVFLNAPIPQAQAHALTTH